MRSVIAGLVALMTVVACAAPSAFVVVPNTPDGATCTRECLVVQNSCLAGGGRVYVRLANGIVTSHPSGGSQSNCYDQHNDCLVTCPGAMRVQRCVDDGDCGAGTRCQFATAADKAGGSWKATLGSYGYCGGHNGP